MTQRALPGLLQRLYVRIWLSVLAAVAVLMLMLGWVWRITTDPPARTVIVQNLAGETIGQGRWNGTRNQHGEVPPDDDNDAGPPEAGAPDAAAVAPHPPFKSGPQFLVRMQDGQDLVIHLPRPPRSPWSRPPTGFLWVLAMVGIGTALVMWPVARRLTRRLEQLQSGVERWGAGDLSARVAMSGTDEVGFLAQRFNSAAERIDQLVRSQKSLLANASHELRSPLARIRMGLELMGTAPTPAIRDEISRNIGELDQLIDEILLASRLDAHEADMGTVEDVDWTGLAAEECARLDVAFQAGPVLAGTQASPMDVAAVEAGPVRAGGVALLADAGAEPGGADAGTETVAPPVLVRGVPKLLRRAVRNLLENARRYGRGEVEATLQHDGSQAVLRVFDRGPGVPVALRERIFEPFYRLPGASESHGGVGLGLALVKSIAERHGGSVRCEERAGGGACFVIALPSAG